MADWLEKGWPSAGLFIGPAAWGISTELNFALAPVDCATQLPLVPISAAILALIALAAGWLSWRAWQRTPKLQGIDDAGAALPHRFLAGMGIGAATLFTAVIVMQGLATLFLNGCER
jgi:hypothetical protein